MLMPRPQRCRGFTLVELMVTISLLAILLALAVPSFRLWINNTRVRTAAQVLQDGLRLAQAEAVRRNRTVSFFLTNDANPTAASATAANGSNWAVRVLPLVTGENAAFVRAGALTGVTSGVTTNGPTIVCFNAAGQQVTNPTEGCTVDPANPTATYNIAHTGGDRTLRVTASLGGRVRMCDPAKTLSATNPDGC